ncbi:MAG: sigma-54-dependent Fis family transcriptional regulator [Chlorobi bacterium]|nr:sigma-54-dependent Fis family transcriptional regulator [Chlorobiota bacterium]
MPVKTGKILAIDDNEDILFSLKLLLKKHVELIHTETDPNKIPELMKNEQYDVIFLDMNFTKDAISGKEGYYWLEKILEIDPNAVVIFITAYGDTDKTVKAIKAGATNFVLKPWQNEKLLATLSSGIKLRRSRKETTKLKNKQKELIAQINQPMKDFIGVSSGMQGVFNTIKKVASTDASILILGENGTGKELVARALHQNSLRKDDVFISVDLGSIAETLFESELFGHVKGAFTDANKDKPGRFEIASGGSLFLDEIGNLSLQMQAKLLTVIERREVTRVGSNKPIPISIRLICATNSDIYKLVAEEKFRQDLLYRINTVEIHLPPLRDRLDDIPVLTEHFLKQYAKKYNKPVKGITRGALKTLYEYNWPGNIRELQHAIERAIIMSDSVQLSEDDFLLSMKSGKVDDLELNTYNLDSVEKTIIQKVMDKYNGNISHMAKELGLTRTSLYRRLEKYGL